MNSIDVTENWPQLSALLDKALEYPEEQRLAWLDTLPPEQATYKAKLRDILTGGFTDNQVLDKPPDIFAAIREHVEQMGAIEEPLAPGKAIGAYRLVRSLGYGGMGAVWLAERADGTFKRQVALKFPYAGPRQRQLVERLMRERDILAGLQHANIARLYDADVTASGQPFLVLEYIEGIAINEYCDQHKLGLQQRLTLFRQVLSAVSYAHAHLVIHRDLKPSNILITPDGVAHLLDFGIATLMTEGEAHASPMTQFDGHVLTPEYASPEQVSGTALSTASDVYSAGVVLYELLTGALPYEHKREQRAQLEHAIINAEIKSAAHIAFAEQAAIDRSTTVKQLRAALRGDLDNVLTKSLKQRVDERYSSIGTFSDDINRYLENQPILARADTPWYQAKKFAQRNRGMMAAIAAVLITLVGGAAAALWQAHLAGEQRDRALALATRGDAITEFMRTMITETADADEPITLQTLLTRTEEVVSKSFSESVDQQVAVLHVLGTYYLALNKSELAKQSFTKALALNTSSADPELMAKLRCNAGQAANQLGEIAAAKNLIEAGIRQSADFPEVQISCLQTRAYVAFDAADYASMLKDITLAQDTLQKSGLNLPVLAAGLLSNLADVEAELGRIADADRHFAMAMEQLIKLGRENHTMAMTIHNNWSGAVSYAGNPRGALEHLDKARDIARARSIDEEASLAFASNRAGQLHKLARYDEALHEYQLGIQIATKNHNVSDVTAAKQGMTRTLIAMGRLTDAQRLIKEVESMIGKELPAEGTAVQNASLLNGMMQLAQQHCALAVPYFSQNIKVDLERNQISGSLLYNFKLRGDAYLCEANIASALEDAMRAYDMALSMQGGLKYSNKAGELALLLAKIESKQNHHSQARKWATIAVEQLQGSLGDEHPTTKEAKQMLASTAIR